MNSETFEMAEGAPRIPKGALRQLNRACTAWLKKRGLEDENTWSAINSRKRKLKYKRKRDRREEMMMELDELENGIE